MASTKLAPLQHDVPLVHVEGDGQGGVPGTPTPYFIQLLQQLLEEKAITDDLAEGAIQQDDLDALVLDDLYDVDTASTPPVEGDGLVWDDDNGLWIPGVVSSGSTFRGVSVYKTANQNITSGGGNQAVTWDAEKFDAGGFHSLSSNTERFTFPTNGYAAATLNLNFASAVGQGVAIINHKNSAGTQLGSWLQDTDTVGADFVSCSTGPIQVSAGDYVESFASVETTRDISSGSTGGTSFSMNMLAEPAALEQGWVLAYSATLSGNTTVDISAFREILMVARDVTTSSTGFRFVQLSHNNGSSFMGSSGDYKTVNATGATTNLTDICGHSSTQTTASLVLRIIGNIVGGTKFFQSVDKGQGFIANTSAISGIITHLRLSGTTSINGGKLDIYGRL